MALRMVNTSLAIFGVSPSSTSEPAVGDLGFNFDAGEESPGFLTIRPLI